MEKAHDKIGAFFSSASSVAIGLLIALIVNGIVRTQTNEIDRELRAGTVALVGVGAFCALVGQLVTGSGLALGLLFALTWGGMAAGILGLVFFVHVEAEQPILLKHYAAAPPAHDNPAPRHSDRSPDT